MTKVKGIVCAVAVLVAAAACADRQDSQITEVEVPEASETPGAAGVSDILDGNNGGNPAFLWLPPVVKEPVRPPDRLARGLSPLVEVCEVGGQCSAGEAEELAGAYAFNLSQAISGKSKGRTFEVRVYGVAGYLLGSFRVTPQSNLPPVARFWIGEGFPAEAAQDCVDDDKCDLGTVVDDEGGMVSVTGTGVDENGNPVTEVIATVFFPEGWSPSGLDRVVTVDCRNDQPSVVADDGSGPLNTVLTQLPWYCNFTVDPPLGPGEQFNEAVTVSVCETITDEHGMVVLGRSSGNADFEFLPPAVPMGLGDCDANYAQGLDVGDAGGFWGDLGRRLASAAIRWIGPEPLRAVMLRDGGAGGTTRVFSDINPVIPATAGGYVVAPGGGGIQGATVTLSRGSSTLVTATTGEDGDFIFRTGNEDRYPLNEGEYTVTVSGVEITFPGGNTRTFTVTESRHYEVLFLPEGIYYYPATGNYYSSSATLRNWESARDAAAALSVAGCVGQLATITSQGENDFITGNMPEAATQGYWLGGFQDVGEGGSGEWEWVSGEPFDYTNWHAGEPNNPETEHWLQFFGAHGVPADEWNNTEFNGTGSGWGSTLEFVCPVEDHEEDHP